MVIDRLRGQEKPLGDIGVAQALRYQREHLDLARGKAGGIVLGHSAEPAGHAADAGPSHRAAAPLGASRLSRAVSG